RGARAASASRGAPGTRVGSDRPAGEARRACARPALRGRLSGRALPRHPPHEERPQALEVERGLLRLAHALDDDREWVQLRAEQPDDEVVVVAVEAMAGEADVVAEPRAPEGHPDAAVFHQDRVLLSLGEWLEGAGTAQGVPDRPRQCRVEHTLARTLDEGLLEIILVPDRVG